MPFHVGPIGLARIGPEANREVVALNGGDVADSAVVDALDGFDLGLVVAIAEAGDEAQVLLLGFLASLENRAQSRSVGGDGLLAENVLVGLDGGLEMNRTEVRRCGEEHNVASINHALVSVEADKLVIRSNINLRLEGRALEIEKAGIELVLEHVAEGDELDVGIGLKGVDGGSASAATATDQADLDGIVFGGVHERWNRGGCNSGRAGDGCAAHEIAASRLRGAAGGGLRGHECSPESKGTPTARNRCGRWIRYA